MSAPVKNPGTFIEIKSSGDLDSLDPAWAFDTASYEALMNVYEPLIFYKRESVNDYVPILSEAVPSRHNDLISSDGLIYKFPIRQGVNFHQGGTLACEDVRYSMLRFMLYDRAGGPSELLLEPIAGLPGTRDETGAIVVDTPDLFSRITCDKETLVIKLKKPYGPFLSIMPMQSYVVSKTWAIKNGDWDGEPTTWQKFNNPKKEASFLYANMNGTGPFMLERWDKNLKQISLVRHEKYWRQPAVLERVIIKGVGEFGTRKLLLASGDADYLDETQGRQYEPQLAHLPGVKLYDFPYVRVEALYFTFKISTAGNTAIYSGKLDGEGIPPDFFTDKNVRKGFAHAFDADVYIKEILRGKANRPTGFMPKEMLGYNPKQPVYLYDSVKAKKYLEQAWGGQVWDKGFRMAIYYDANNTYRQMACEILKRGVEALNSKFKIDLRGIQWSTYLAESRAHKLPIFKIGWTADYTDPHNFAYAFLHSRGSYPLRQGFGYPEWDRMIDEANVTIDAKKREMIYFKLQEMAFEEVPQIYTDQPLVFRAMRDWVKGFYWNPMFPGVYFYGISKE
ncbi:MAG: ABC transporter substrate-binding protein [Elusimicrobia bacterium]|nr:ABC transporter substrate-binding protein [Elusimicrobiota bacterium]